MTANKPISITLSDYEQEVLHSPCIVLVVFYAKWCPKCAMTDHLLNELSNEYIHTLKVCKIEIDESPDLADQFDIQTVPTFIVFRNGKPFAAASGILSKDSLLEMIFSDTHTSTPS